MKTKTTPVPAPQSHPQVRVGSLVEQAADTLNRVRDAVMRRAVTAGSPQAWALLFDAADAAHVRMGHRAGLLFALSAEAMAGPYRHPANLAETNYESIDDGSKDLRIVDAALLLASGGEFEGEPVQDAAPKYLRTYAPGGKRH